MSSSRLYDLWPIFSAHLALDAMGQDYWPINPSVTPEQGPAWLVLSHWLDQNHVSDEELSSLIALSLSKNTKTSLAGLASLIQLIADPDRNVSIDFNHGMALLRRWFSFFSSTGHSLYPEKQKECRERLYDVDFGSVFFKSIKNLNEKKQSGAWPLLSTDVQTFQSLLSDCLLRSAEEGWAPSKSFLSSLLLAKSAGLFPENNFVARINSRPWASILMALRQNDDDLNEIKHQSGIDEKDFDEWVEGVEEALLRQSGRISSEKSGQHDGLFEKTKATPQQFQNMIAGRDQRFFIHGSGSFVSLWSDNIEKSRRLFGSRADEFADVIFPSGSDVEFAVEEMRHFDRSDNHLATLIDFSFLASLPNISSKTQSELSKLVAQVALAYWVDLIITDKDNHYELKGKLEYLCDWLDKPAIQKNLDQSQTQIIELGEPMVALAVRGWEANHLSQDITFDRLQQQSSSMTIDWMGKVLSRLPKTFHPTAFLLTGILAPSLVPLWPKSSRELNFQNAWPIQEKSDGFRHRSQQSLSLCKEILERYKAFCQERIIHQAIGDVASTEPKASQTASLLPPKRM